MKGGIFFALRASKSFFATVATTTSGISGATPFRLRI